MSLLRASTIIAVFLLISKVFGLVRELFVAAYFGAGHIADAYTVAYILPGFALVMLGGLNGPFHSAIVSIISKYNEKKDTENSKKIINTIIILSIIVMGIITVIGIYFAPLIIKIIGPNLPENTIKIAILQFKIMMPMFLISGLLGIYYGILNLKNHVLIPALSPVMASIAIIVAIILFYKTTPETILAYGTMLGAVFQLLIQFIPLLKPELLKNISLSFDVFHKGVKDVIYILLPAVLSSTIGQINIIISSFFASGLEVGSIAAFRYANDLVQLPLGVLVTALLVPLLPAMCISATKNDNYASLKTDVNKAVRAIIRITLFTMAILFSLGQPLIAILFQRGAFDERATALTLSVLLYLTISIVFYACRDLLVRVFYALSNAKIPFYCSLISAILYALLNWLLYKPMGIAGISLATSLVTVISFAILSYILFRKIGVWWTKETFKILFYSLLISCFIFFIGLYLNNIFFLVHGFILKITICFTGLFILTCLYGFGLIMLKDTEAKKIIDLIFGKIRYKLHILNMLK